MRKQRVKGKEWRIKRFERLENLRKIEKNWGDGGEMTPKLGKASQHENQYSKR